MPRHIGFAGLLLALIASLPLAQTPSPATDRLVARLDQARPFVGQPIAYTVEIYDAGYATNRIYTPPSFIGFGQQPQLVPAGRPVLLDGQTYTLLSQTTLLYPLYPGPITIESARLDIPESIQHPPLSLRSESFSLEVRPLPADAPPSFKNAIGLFSLQASLNRAEILVGAEVALSLTVQGAGNLERLLPPDLPLPTGWRAVLQDQTLDMLDIYSGRKTFTWAIYPDPSSTGPITISPIIFSAFNPQTERYETRSSDALSLTILGQAAPTASALPTQAAPAATPLPLLPIPDPEALPAASPTPWLVLLAPPPLIFLLVALLTRSKPSAQPTTPRPGRAAATPRQRLRLQAAHALPPLQACAEVAEVLQALQAQSSFANWPNAAQRRLRDLLKTAQAAPYAPLTSADSAALVDDALALLDALNKARSTPKANRP